VQKQAEPAFRLRCSASDGSLVVWIGDGNPPLQLERCAIAQPERSSAWQGCAHPDEPVRVPFARQEAQVGATDTHMGRSGLDRSNGGIWVATRRRGGD